MQFLYKFGTSKKQKQRPLEAEDLNFRVLMECLNQKKFEKVKGSNIVSCVQRKYFSFIIDKIVLLGRICSKALFILSWFLLLFLLFLK